jgi:hypothetical protein
MQPSIAQLQSEARCNRSERRIRRFVRSCNALGAAMMHGPFALQCNGPYLTTMEKQTVVNRFLGLDGYEWFVMLVGSPLIALATWLM